MKMSETGKFESGWTTKYKCDMCPATFLGADIILKEEKTDVGFSSPLMPIGGVQYNDKFYLMHCPECDYVHTRGFDPASSGE